MSEIIVIAAAVTGAAVAGLPARRLAFFLFLTVIQDSGLIISNNVRFGRLTLGMGPFHGLSADAAVFR